MNFVEENTYNGVVYAQTLFQPDRGVTDGIAKMIRVPSKKPNNLCDVVVFHDDFLPLTITKGHVLHSRRLCMTRFGWDCRPDKCGMGAHLILRVPATMLGAGGGS